MRRAVRGAGVAISAVGLLAGCSLKTEAKPDEPVGNPQNEVKESVEPSPTVAVGGRVGGPGSPCELPVSFDLAADWAPKPVVEDTQFGLTSMGAVTLKCEIDAKPAGIIGFLRIWVGAKVGEDSNAVLKEFVAENAKSRKSEVFTQGQAGGFKMAEVTYLNTNEFIKIPKKERAFALATPKGVVVFDLGGLDSAEHEEMLPAYELAKKSLKAN
ncbi:lipoprotein [Streptomyces albipurpureus]|uniref:Lipoprotein n=1 Tax=Streptomyces albipurpureus TaxID=2897419 RepID=A0ABT0UR95_9ACTN|nr:lipoprotein [Streptomyces sp. CWNU-1]MCM2391138.1 lipoprotein [Streptomyces sp. CWNU-1]